MKNKLFLAVTIWFWMWSVILIVITFRNPENVDIIKQTVALYCLGLIFTIMLKTFLNAHYKTYMKVVYPELWIELHNPENSKAKKTEYKKFYRQEKYVKYNKDKNIIEFQKLLKWEDIALKNITIAAVFTISAVMTI